MIAHILPCSLEIQVIAFLIGALLTFRRFSSSWIYRAQNSPQGTHTNGKK